MSFQQACVQWPVCPVILALDWDPLGLDPECRVAPLTPAGSALGLIRIPLGLGFSAGHSPGQQLVFMVSGPSYSMLMLAAVIESSIRFISVLPVDPIASITMHS